MKIISNEIELTCHECVQLHLYIDVLKIIQSLP